MSKDLILEVRNLSVEFDTYGGVVNAVRDVSFGVERGKTLAIVGESGCGKSVTVQSVMGLIPMPPGRITTGSAKLDGEEILGLPQKQVSKLRGARIGMIFQDALASMNPTMPIGKQIAEPLVVHKGLSRSQAMKQAVELLDRTKIPEAAKRAKQYPFEFSGGMLQRAMIAMSLACSPNILIADEPTTALDVTIQAQILQLLRELQQQQGMSIILITHDLGVVAQMADQVAVMYAGQIIETGTVDDIFYRPSHPYTLGLRSAMPETDETQAHRLEPIPGSPPDLFNPPTGCGYAPRCPNAMTICQQTDPESFVIAEDDHITHESKCWLQHKDAPKLDSGLHQLARSGM